MKEKVDFQMTVETVAIYPFTSDTGAIHSAVIHANEILFFPVRPIEIIDYNLRLIGSSLRGAKDSAKRILKSASMYPVVTDIVKRIVWFPTESMKNDTCAWVSLNYYKRLFRIDDYVTKIHLHGKYDLTVPVSENPIDNRVNSAHYLRSILLQNANTHLFRYGQGRQEVMLVRDGLRVEYELKHNEQKGSFK